MPRINGSTSPDPVDAVMDGETGIILLTVHGRWSRDLWLEAYRMVNKCLAEHPTALLADLRDLDDPAAQSAPLWLTAASHGSRKSPPVPMAACAGSASALTRRLQTLNARLFLPVFATLPLARTALTSHRLAIGQVRLELPARSSSAVVARQIVADACTEWRMPMLVSRARLVVSELVMNAVEHARTPIDVVVSRRGPVDGPHQRRLNRLHLAVFDQDDRIPRLPTPRGSPEVAPSERGQGLRLVDAAAQGWGVLPTRTGKVVWAILKERAERR